MQCQFVHNRVDTIRRFNEKHNATWNYCPSASNPADLLSRGATHRQFQSSKTWPTGPEWLLKQSDWPAWEGNSESAAVFHLSVLTSVSTSTPPPPTTKGIEKVLDISRYKLSSLVRVTAIILRFINNIKLETKSRSDWKIGSIRVPELNSAEETWLLTTQRQHFSEELEYLQDPTGKRPALVSQLDLFIGSDGLIRCNGRLANAQLKKDTIHPILLPKDSALTTLVILSHHALMLHGGVKLTIASIRQRYWIPQIGQSVKKCLRSCVKCNRVRGAAYMAPNHAPLPVSRSSFSIPFTVTGIDFTGSFIIRGPKEAPKKDRIVYILLFTCASTRAIHLEVVEDLTTLSFLEAFRCFIAHHSRPAIIMSDNAKTFEKGAKVFQKIFRDPVTTKQLSDQKVEWRFIPKRAPWYGGFWERLVGMAKEALSKILGRSKPTLSAFRALVADAEAVLNDRPLENPSSVVSDGESLSPAHLMYGRRLNVLHYNKEIDDEKLDSTYGERPDELKKAVIRHQSLIGHFKKRFLSSYLPALREYHQATRKSQPAVVKKEDVVLIHDEKPRKEWKLAVIENLIRSTDGEIRAADIRTANGKTNRPISKLYPLQMTEPASVPVEISSCPANVPTRSRPVRKCAIKAKAAVKRIFEQE